MKSLRDAKNEWRKAEKRWWRAILARDYDRSDKLRRIATEKHSMYVNHSHYGHKGDIDPLIEETFPGWDASGIAFTIL